MGQAAFDLSPSAERAYDTACAYARGGEPDAALELLRRAASLGFSDAGHAETDSDLASLRTHAGFASWLGQLRHARS